MTDKDKRWHSAATKRRFYAMAYGGMSPDPSRDRADQIKDKAVIYQCASVDTLMPNGDKTYKQHYKATFGLGVDAHCYVVGITAIVA